MSNADELLKYKELLDSNIITPEEFEKKKKELLDGKTIIKNNVEDKAKINVNNKKSEQAKKNNNSTVFAIILIFICFCILVGMNVPTNNYYYDYEVPIVLDVNKFYKENKTDTVTEEELIQIMGEPTKKDTWNYKIINKSYKITTLLYPESKEFHFYKGKLSWITITEEYKYYSDRYTLAMFNLAKNENTIEVQNNNTSFRYRNCGVYDFWVTKDVLSGNGDYVNWIKIKLVESEF